MNRLGNWSYRSFALGPRGARSSSAKIVMMTAITASLNASRRLAPRSRGAGRSGSPLMTLAMIRRGQARRPARGWRAHGDGVGAAVAASEPRGRPGADGGDPRRRGRAASTHASPHATEPAGGRAPDRREAEAFRDQTAPARGRRLRRSQPGGPLRGAPGVAGGTAG